MVWLVHILKALRELIYIFILIVIYEYLRYANITIKFIAPVEVSPFQIIFGGLFLMLIITGLLYALHEYLDKKIKELEDSN